MSLPTWLLQSGPALLKRHVRPSKYDPLVEEVELLQVNPQYAHVRLPDGRETTVSIRHLAPAGSPSAEGNEGDVSFGISPSEANTKMENEDFEQGSDPGPAEDRIIPRRSSRTRRPPERLDL
ncbi:hypothetical protein M514_08451 [Trichuris suis]|uniref:Uncharacterized protein n=1 Tax=Trichuris suis TaxID=68888 RepID=A0A085MWF8_9BILA|nr:hypothetical protein M514_08451 [Trichuris suis]